jgi:hypothetical protein
MGFLSLLMLTGGLFVAMVVLVFVGHWFGLRSSSRHGEKLRGNVVDVAVFGLLSLLIAFSFNGAVARLDMHRQLIAEEVNAIGTMSHRVDLLPASAQPAFRSTLREYVQSRIDVYDAKLEPTSEPALRSARLREELWRQGIDACRGESCPAPTVTLVSTALDTMFAFPIKQSLMARMHPPGIVFGMLYGLAILCAFLVGYDLAGAKTKTWRYAFAFPCTTTAIIWVILDVEYPRLGVNRLHDLEQLLRSLLATLS